MVFNSNTGLFGFNSDEFFGEISCIMEKKLLSNSGIFGNAGRHFTAKGRNYSFHPNIRRATLYPSKSIKQDAIRNFWTNAVDF